MLAQKMTKSSGKKVVPETCSDDRKWSEMPRKHIPILGDIFILVPKMATRGTVLLKIIINRQIWYLKLSITSTKINAIIIFSIYIRGTLLN